MKNLTVIFVLFTLTFTLAGQEEAGKLTGKVSFKSSRNTYVRFISTEGIAEGDSLFISDGGRLIPVLVVNSLSSVSCVCTPIEGSDVPVDHLIVARMRQEVNTQPDKPVTATAGKEPVKTAVADSVTPRSKGPVQKQVIRGNISVNSYSDLSDTEGGNSQRFRYSLSLDIPGIAGTGFYFTGHASFIQKAGDLSVNEKNVLNTLKLYNLGAGYKFGKTADLFLGRRVNPRIAGLGAADGIQFEKAAGRFTLGLLAGTRPDFSDYGFNSSLYQFGGYLAFDAGGSGWFTSGSLAFVDQMNGSATDRRFLYFQHSVSPVKSLSLMTSFEIDLYKLENDMAKSTFDLTGAWVSVRMNISKKITLSGSYDARKNVIYYETWKTYTDRILENELRQGFRLNAGWRISNTMSAGVQSGYRFLKSDPRPSRNVHGYFTYSPAGMTGFSAAVSGTLLESSYLSGIVTGARLSGRPGGGTFTTSIGYYFNRFTFRNEGYHNVRHTGEAALYIDLPGKILTGANYELNLEPNGIYHRIYLQLRKRF